jgi:hypothetical protein
VSEVENEAVVSESTTEAVAEAPKKTRKGAKTAAPEGTAEPK